MQQIYDTGIRGYLRWLQQDQPEVYRVAAPIIAQKVPDAFSDHEQSLGQGALMGFADDAGSSGTSGATSGDGSASAGPDVADAANAGSASPNVIGAIGAIVNGIASLRLQGAQLNTYSQINNAQLQRAATAGLPLATTTGSLGIPLISGFSAAPGSITGNGVLIAVAAVVALLLLGRRSA